jgi:6-phosphogluconate dehydrogenase
VLAAVDVGAPANVLSAALFERFASRGEADFADQLLSAMRMRSSAATPRSRPPAG